MYQPYGDIRSRLGEPLWHDRNGVPRYEAFHPSSCDVYAKYAALLKIRCQGCGREFLVADTWSFTDAVERKLMYGNEMIQWDSEGKNGRPIEDLPDFTSPNCFGYGDAPWHTIEGSPCSGTTMTTEIVAVVEFWRREDGEYEWKRDSAHEFEYKEDQHG